MRKLIAIVMMLLPMLAMLTGCKSDEDKVRETAEAYLYKNMKNPESLKILSCEIRKDTIPFWLSENMFDLAEKCDKAMDKFNHYKDMSYLFIDEKIESANEFSSAREALINAYKYEQQNDSAEIEYVAYVKSSGTNPMGGTVSNSTIVIIDKDNPEKILGSYVVNSDFIGKFAVIKMLGADYEFKTNKFGKYETEGLPYIEQFIMNDAE